MNRIITASILSFIISGLPLMSIADHSEDHKIPTAHIGNSGSETVEVMREAATTYGELLKNSTGNVPSSVFAKSNCIAVVPNLTTAAVVVGGSHGDGVVSCRTSDLSWSAPAFFDLNAASLGAQVGAKSTKLVLFFTSKEAVASLKRGTFELGADASVAAGTFDKSFDVGQTGVIAYQQSSGAYVGASLVGGKLSSDVAATRSYYGKSVEVADLLEGRSEKVSTKGNPLLPLLPNV